MLLAASTAGTCFRLYTLRTFATVFSSAAAVRRVPSFGDASALLVFGESWAEAALKPIDKTTARTRTDLAMALLLRV
jgi:hypothetical protein